MWLSSWLRIRKRPTPSGRSTGFPGKRPSLRPQLEALEDRWLPSQIGLTVTSLADSGPDTLRAAIQTADASSPSDKFTIGFAVTGTIDLQSPLPDLNNSIAIQGPGAGSLTVERAAGASFSSALLTVDAGQNTTLSGLTIANGNAGGIADDGGTLTVSGCTISGNSGQNGGGLSNTGTVTISNSTLIGNTASHDGGGIWNAGTLTVSTSTISGNGAAGDAGGAIMNFAGPLTVRACTVTGNSAAVGGGIYNNIYGSATIQQNSTLSGNSATFQGGGILNAGSLTVSNSALSGNSAFEGGGIYNAGTTTVWDSIFGGSSTNSSNSAELGGAIYNGVFGTLDVRGSTFLGNTASDSGGAVYNLGTATLQEGTVSGNTAVNEGGGLFNGSTGMLTVDDSLVWDNTALLGADLYTLALATLHDSTVGDIYPSS